MPWTKERIAELKSAEVRQLRTNAERLREHEVVALCDDVLSGRPKKSAPRKIKRQHELDARPLVSRSKAFEMRGVKLHNPRWSWGGIRPTDGTVVFTVWANEIQKDDNSCRYLLWAPNRDGSSPWSDRPGGKERLKHCQLALAHGSGEGVLIYGATSGLDVPPEEASTVTGADPNTVLRFEVRLEGEEYWAVWRTSSSSTT
jgi:hypothetical protein